MKNKLYSVLIAFAFIIGFQSYAQAQITVTNQSACTIRVAVIQENMNTQNRCDWCGISPITNIAPGASRVFQRDPSCGFQFWNSVAWGTNSFGLSSQSMNPFYQGTCLPDVLFANCGFFNPGVLTANWSVTPGGGSAQVTIQ